MENFKTFDDDLAAYMQQKYGEDPSWIDIGMYEEGYNALIASLKDEFKQRGYSSIDIDQRLKWMVNFWIWKLSAKTPCLEDNPWDVPVIDPVTFSVKDPAYVAKARDFLREHGYVVLNNEWTDEEMLENVMIWIKNVFANQQYQDVHRIDWWLDKDLNNKEHLKELAEMFLSPKKTPYEKEILKVCKPLNSDPVALGCKCGNSHWAMWLQIAQRFDVRFMNELRQMMGLEELPVAHVNRSIGQSPLIVPSKKRPAGVKPGDVALKFLHADVNPERVGLPPQVPMRELSSKTHMTGGKMHIVIGPRLTDKQRALFRLLYINDADPSNKNPGLRVSNNKTEIRWDRDYLGMLRGAAKYGGSSEYGCVCVSIPDKCTAYWSEDVLHGKHNNASEQKQDDSFAFGWYGGIVHFDHPVMHEITTNQGMCVWESRKWNLEEGTAPMVYPCAGDIGAGKQPIPGKPNPLGHMPKCYTNFPDKIQEHADKLDPEQIQKWYYYAPKDPNANWCLRNPGQKIKLQPSPNWPPRQDILGKFRDLPLNVRHVTGWTGEKPPTGKANMRLVQEILDQEAGAAGGGSAKKPKLG